MESLIKCDEEVSNIELVNSVKNRLLPDDEIFDLAELFKVFGDSTRMKILNALMCQEMCVCDIAYSLGMTKSAISHQLRYLREANLLTSSKVGKEVYYRLADSHIKDLYEIGLKHIKERL